MRTIRWATTLSLLTLLSAGCEKRTGTDEDPSALGEDAQAPAGWDLATVEERLQAGRLQPTRAGEVRQPFLGPPGVLFGLAGGEVQVYLYIDRTARAAETDRLDPERVAPPEMMITWRMPATLIVSDNLAVVLLTQNPAVREQVRNALGQVPPAPPH